MSLGDAFGAALARLHEACPEIRGTVLATREGLILASSGELSSDAAAASAVHLADELDRSLALLSGEGCEDMLVWTQAAVWCLVRLEGQSVLMARAGRDCRAGTLRLAADQTRRELAHPLAPMTQTPHGL